MFKCYLVLFIICTNSFSYVLTKSNVGDNVRWKKRNSQISLYINPSSTIFNSVDVVNILTQSIDSWNQVVPYKIIAKSSRDQTDGSIQFSSDPRYFSSGVVAVTKMSYQDKSAVIYDASILVNESISQHSLLTADKSLSANGFAYLGDVLTHELGHLMGLSHSEVYDSSMIFSIFKGQHKISSDDIHAIKNLYNVEGSGHSISGRVVAGDGDPVFGAHVQLISLKNNTVVAGKFSDFDGKFKFENLKRDDEYILFMDKIKNNESLESDLGKSSSRYCNSETYAPSFLSSCDRSKKGESKILRIGNSINKDIGDFTIRCSTQVKSDYLYSKTANESYATDMRQGQFTHTGYFSKEEISGVNPSVDKYHFDLRALWMNPMVSNKLRLNFMSHKLSSMFLASIQVKNLETGTITNAGYTFNPDTGKVNSEIQISLNLSLVESENNFEISITPVAMTQSQKNEVFAIPSLMGRELGLYHLTGQVFTGNESYLVDEFYQDNSSCLEGEVAYKIAKSINAGPSSADKLSSAAFSCATVKVEDSPGNFYSLIVGFMLMFSFFFIKYSVDKVLSK